MRYVQNFFDIMYNDRFGICSTVCFSPFVVSRPSGRLIYSQQWGDSMDKDYKNSEGYADPTAYHALQNIEADKRITELVHVLKFIIRNSDFELVERIQLRDKKTGRVYK